MAYETIREFLSKPVFEKLVEHLGDSVDAIFENDNKNKASYYREDTNELENENSASKKVQIIFNVRNKK